MNISAPLASINVATAEVTGPNVVAAASPESSPQAPPVAATEGVKVSLSAAGMQKSADDKKPKSNADIESSGLPDQTQKTLKMIRELKQKIEEKQQEMRALMGDQTMDPDTKQSKVGALQTAIATLTAGLATANNALEKQGKSGKLSAAQVQQASVLAMK